MYADIFEEMMRMMQETSKAKRQRSHEKPGAKRVCQPSPVFTEQQEPAGIQRTGSSSAAENRVHLHRMPSDPGAVEHERKLLHEQIRTGNAKAIILEFPGNVSFSQHRESSAGVAGS
jgi:hypothetical protein